MLLHYYLVNALSASCTWDRWPAPRNTGLIVGLDCGIQISQIWTQSITRSGLSCKVASTRQKSVA